MKLTTPIFIIPRLRIAEALPFHLPHAFIAKMKHNGTLIATHGNFLFNKDSVGNLQFA
jgi:hypothetical protein